MNIKSLILKLKKKGNEIVRGRGFSRKVKLSPEVGGEGGIWAKNYNGLIQKQSTIARQVVLDINKYNLRDKDYE